MKQATRRIQKIARLVYFHYRFDTQHPFEFYARYVWIFLLCITQRFFFQTGHWPSSITFGNYSISFSLFIMSGFAMTRLVFIAPSLFHDTLNHLRQTGLLGWTLTTPTGLWEIFATNVIWKSLVIISEFLAVVLFAGPLVGIPIRPFFQWSIFLATGLGIAAYLGMGMMLSAVTLLAKRGTIVFRLLVQLSIVLGGVFFPFQALPEKIIFSAHLLPLTSALQIIRSSLIHAGFSELRTSFWILTSLTLFFLIFGTFLLQAALFWLKKQGRLVT